MDVLGHGVPETDLAHLTSPEQYTSRNADRRITQLHPRARMTGSARNRSAAPKRHRRAERRFSFTAGSRCVTTGKWSGQRPGKLDGVPGLFA
jgi:hypothetical protein